MKFCMNCVKVRKFMNNTFWTGFKSGNWQDTIDVRDFIQTNYSPYLGDESFLSTTTKRTAKLLNKLNNYYDAVAKHNR